MAKIIFRHIHSFCHAHPKAHHFSIFLDDESDNNYAESEIESDMHALEILKQENGEKEKKRPNSELIESELRNIANDIEHVADNIKRTSSQENILQK